MTEWQWSDWIAHDDAGWPQGVEPDEIVQCALSGHVLAPMPAAHHSWHCPSDPVTHYRRRKHKMTDLATKRGTGVGEATGRGTAQIVSLQGAELANPAEPVPEIIETLEAMLEAAKRGEIRAIAIASVDSRYGGGTAWEHDGHCWDQMLAAACVLQGRLVAQSFGGDE